MAETDQKNENEKQEVDYVGTIEELKKNSVPTSDYNSVVEENKRLLKALVDGGQMANPNPESEKTSDEIAKELCTPGITNLRYCQLALEHRKKCLEEGKKDPFVPDGLDFKQGLRSDAEDAQEVADMLEACIEQADGNPDMFTSLFQAHVRDLPRPASKGK